MARPPATQTAGVAELLAWVALGVALVAILVAVLGYYQVR
jgi:hypothetical protein